MEQELDRLRADLKCWERKFAASHDGRKAGREDIKQHTEIASKYKTYDKLRRSLAIPSVLQPDAAGPAKRPAIHKESHDLRTETPNKRVKHGHQPSQPWIIDPYDPPVAMLMSPSKVRASIGPTPQKNGKVLGLFDGLSSHSGHKTPSKRNALLPVAANVQNTPSKSRLAPEISADHATESTVETKIVSENLTPAKRRQWSKTSPMSSGKALASTSEATPAFLRRDSQRYDFGERTVEAEDDALSWSPVAVRKKTIPMGRGLSTLVRSLKQMEDEDLDEDLDLLRDIEAEERGEVERDDLRSNTKSFVQDTQPPEMSLGPDRAPESEEDEEHGAEGTKQNLVSKWKKRGQKRTTRKVQMKPSNVKWKPEPLWRCGSESESEDREPKAAPGCNSEKLLSQTKAHADDEHNRRAGSKELQETSEKSAGRGGLLSQVRKKISAAANPNFRALKIKNRNSKGKKGMRFGRRR